MVRDLRRLADTRFDVLVIGAGIYGAATAWDASSRGLSVAIVDRGDFGGGTSFNNLKTLHGGLRSLQALNLPQMRRFIRERRALARIAPHLVRPLPFLVATGSAIKRSRLVMRAALALNDAIASDRNEGLPDPALHLPAGRIVSRAEALRLNPLISPDGVTGGAVWHDYQMTNADRMTLSFVLSAVRAGAVAANYAEATTPVMQGNRIAGMRIRDRRTDDTFDVRAGVVINAAGAWAPGLVSVFSGRASAVPAARLSRAMNVVVGPVETHGHACGGLVDGRFLFMVPWRDVTMMGTSHDAHEGAADTLTVTARDLDAFLAEGRAAFPRAELGRANVRMVHRGLLPMIDGHGTDVRLLRESTVVDHAAHGAPGLVSIHGVRYTTARDTAQAAVDAAFRVLGHHAPPPCGTATLPLFGGEMTDVRAFVRSVVARDLPDVPQDVRARVAAAYGTAVDPVLQLASEAPALALPLGADCAVTGAEILHAARHEMAVTLADAVLRRTEAGSAGHPGEDALRRAAAVLARHHEWDALQTEREIAEVEAFYRLPD